MNSLFTILIYLVIINLITFLAMYIDKKRAKWGKWRIKESTLFALVLLGGGIGGIVGMYTFRHKTKKPNFVIAIDALASLSIDRINKTIQITDTGIHPGSGIGNNRKEISQKTKKMRFVIGFPAILIVEIVCVIIFGFIN